MTDTGSTVNVGTPDFLYLVAEKPLLKTDHCGDEYFDGGIPVLVGEVELNDAVIDSEVKLCHMSAPTWEHLKDNGLKFLSMQKLTLEE